MDYTRHPKRTYRLDGEDQDDLIVKLRDGKALPERTPEENKKLLVRIIELVKETGNLSQTTTENHDVQSLCESSD